MLWHNRAFLLLSGGRSISALGSSTSGIAFTLLILGLTQSPSLAGLAGGLAALPPAILGLAAGVLVDRYNPKRLVILCDAIRAIALISIPIAQWDGHLSIVQIYAVILLGGAMLVVYNTAVLTVLPRIVPQQQLAASSAQYEGAFYAAGLAGPSIGGIFYGVAQAIPFLLDAASYLGSILSMLLIKQHLGKERAAPSESLRVETRAGLAWFWHNPLIRSVSVIEGGEVLILSGTTLLVIVLARSQHASSGLTGLALSIGAVGGILGALAASSLQRFLGFDQIMVGVQWARVVLYPLYAIAPNPVALGLITAGIYFLNPVRNAALFRYAVPLIPDALRGRVMAIWDLGPSTAAVIGAPLAGVVLQRAGPKLTIIGITFVAVMLAVTMTLNPYIREAAIEAA